ncbi:putative F-box domain-containing protein [Helianthus annuus]|nr:putative F-box domain-containing protein [Helianthus annuus]
MANVCDDVLHNILARLPGKPLLRFRCVSKHWNGLISDPYFMKSRSRRMILLKLTRSLVVVDDTEAVKLLHSPLEHEEEGTRVSMVGALNGIVLLALIYCKSLRYKLVLYNPLTCASKILVVMGPPSIPYPDRQNRPYVFGFGYGATKDDLKILRLENVSYPQPVGSHYCKYDVFDLKTCSWSKRRDLAIKSDFHNVPGTFLNGFLYWLTFSSRFGILALNVKDMVFSNIKLPDEIAHVQATLLGSIGGCLCVTNKAKVGYNNRSFNLWLMKEEGSWMKAHSFTFSLETSYFFPTCILGYGQILLQSSSNQFVIYDTSNESHKTINGLPTLKGIETLSDFDITYMLYCFQDQCSIEYVESLVSPSDLCFN